MLSTPSANSQPSKKFWPEYALLSWYVVASADVEATRRVHARDNELGIVNALQRAKNEGTEELRFHTEAEAR